MQCKFCLEEMELKYTEGMSTNEISLYSCIMCESEVTIHENGEEDTWIQSGK